jgi:transketolase
MRAIAGLPVVVPADPAQTRDALRWAVEQETGSYLRIGRFKVPATTPADAAFATGKAVQLTDGDDAAILAVGSLVPRAVDAARRLAADGIRARVLNMTFVSPLDVEAVLAAAQTGGIVTAEEATVSGGLGAAVASLVAEHRPVPMRILGVRDSFAPTGSASFLLEHFGLTVDGIENAVREVLGRAGR